MKHINKDNDNKYYFHTTFKLESVGRVHTVAIYNSSVWGGNRYLYSGKYYVLYVESATSWSSNKGNIIKNGLNVVLVPAAIFVNSQLYQKIKSNDISYLQGTKPSDARLGAIDKKSMPVHIVGMFFFKSDGTKMKNMISLLCHNLSNEQFAHYAAITPEQVNIPSDVLEAIPYEGIQNSKTGGAPENLWQQLSGAIGGAITSVADFIYHGLVALGNFIEHAAEVVAQFAMKLWSTGVSVVKQAVEVIKKAVDAVVEWIKSAAINLLNNVLTPIENKINEWLQNIKDTIVNAYEYYKANEKLSLEWEEKLKEVIYGKGLYVMLGIGAALIAGMYVITGVSMGIGAAAMGILGPLIAGLVAEEIMNKMYSSGYELPFDLPTSFSMDAVKNIVDNLINQIKRDTKDSEWDLIEAFLGNIFGISGIITTLYTAARYDLSGTLLTELTVGLSFWALPYYAIALALPEDKPVQTIFGAIGLIFSIPALLSVIEVKSIMVVPNSPLKILWSSSWLLTVFSTGIFVTSMLS